MSQQPMRGSRLGAESFEQDTNKNLSPRQTCLYRCANDHTTEMIFSADAEIPVAWGVEGKQAFETELPKAPRTHFEMLLERRSREELEELLTERLGELKARRARGQADATNS
ncbi:MAG: hypothetical protein EBT26_08485 [Microbacteriaceae bacterium]|nr:hypothetical protein [Microbacteriaceae bacterium]